MDETPLVAVRGLRKRYGDVVAVDNMNLVVRRGDVHAVVGENGAGKSTLMKTLAGVVRPDAGEIEFDGVPVVISSPVVARQYGVGIVYQELMRALARTTLRHTRPPSEATSIAAMSRCTSTVPPLAKPVGAPDASSTSP